MSCYWQQSGGRGLKVGDFNILRGGGVGGVLGGRHIPI